MSTEVAPKKVLKVKAKKEESAAPVAVAAPVAEKVVSEKVKKSTTSPKTNTKNIDEIIRTIFSVLSLDEKQQKQVKAEIQDLLPSTSAFRKNKKNRNKDPNAPKKPQTGFLKFAEDNRSKIKQEHPEWDMLMITKEIGARWGAIDEKTKAHYTDIQAENKKKYAEEMKVYNSKKAAEMPEVVEEKKEKKEKKVKKEKKAAEEVVA